MIYIFHGADQFASRNGFNSFLDKNNDSEIFRIDNKNVDLDQINNFLNGRSLFITKKILAITNLFSISKPILDKIIKILKTNQDIDVAVWQDKTITPTQIKSLPKTEVSNFPLDQIIFSCINNLKPKNIKQFIPLFYKVLEKEPFELFLFWIKNNLRKQMTSYSRFNIDSLKKTYLQIIELDFQNKTGQLSISKELALERILLNLIK